MTLVIILCGCEAHLTEQASCCRNFAISMRSGKIYVTMDKTAEKMLP
jgi:hypothetical protein